MKYLPLCLLFLATFAVAQEYTQSTTFGCNQQVCNGLPLDQGGTWQFIEANRAFSVSNIVNGVVVFGIYGYPGNTDTYNPQTGQAGGMYDIADAIPQPPNLSQNGSTGAEGTLSFDFGAISDDKTTYYVGHVVVQGHRVRHFVRSPRGSGSFYTQLVVDDAGIFIDQSFAVQ